MGGKRIRRRSILKGVSAGAGLHVLAPRALYSHEYTATATAQNESQLTAHPGNEGDRLLVEGATANTDFYIEAHYNDTTVQSDDFEANTEVTDIALTLDPPINESTLVEVKLIGTNGSELLTEFIRYEMSLTSDEFSSRINQLAPENIETVEGEEAFREIQIQGTNGEALIEVRPTGVVYIEDEVRWQVNADDEWRQALTAETAEQEQNVQATDEMSDEAVEAEAKAQAEANPVVQSAERVDNEAYEITFETEEAAAEGTDAQPDFLGQLYLTIRDQDWLQVGVCVLRNVSTFQVSAIVWEVIRCTLPWMPSPVAELRVNNQVGDGDQLRVERATASDAFYVEASYNGTAVRSDSFEPGEELTDLTIDLDPSIEGMAAVEVSVYAAADDATLASRTIEYAGIPPDPAEFAVSITEVPDSVEAGQVVEVNSKVENVGEEVGTQDVKLVVDEHDPPTADMETITLSPDESETITLRFQTETVANDREITVAVETDNDVDERSVSVEGAITIEFVDCKRAEVTGRFEEGDTLTGEVLFFDSAGPGNDHSLFAKVGEHVEAPFSGTIILQIGEERRTARPADDELLVEVPDSGFGARIGVVIYNWLGETEFGKENPHDCLNVTRPDRPSIEVQNVTSISERAYEVTFGYENPNEVGLGSGEFTEGTTENEPPDRLNPGEDTFAVKWTPQDATERLVWELDLLQYGYEDPLRAETEPARKYAATGLDITIVETDSPVDAGASMDVVAELHNSSGQEVSENIQLIVGKHNPTIEDTATVTVAPGGNKQITLGFESAVVDNDQEFPVVVEGETDSDEELVLVYGADGSGQMLVNIISTTSPVNAGEVLEVTTKLYNSGNEELTQEVRLIVGKHTPTEEDTERVTLGPGERQTITLSFESAVVDNDQEFPVVIESGNSRDQEQVLVYGTD